MPIQSRKGEGIQDISGSEQVQFATFIWSSSDVTSTTWKHAYLHAENNVKRKKRTIMLKLESEYMINRKRNQV